MAPALFSRGEAAGDASTFCMRCKIEQGGKVDLIRYCLAYPRRWLRLPQAPLRFVATDCRHLVADLETAYLPLRLSLRDLQAGE